MSANVVSIENEMVEAAVGWLRDRLPETWQINPSNQTIPEDRRDAGTAVEVKDSRGTYATIAVEARTTLRPRDVDQLLGTLGRTLRALAGSTPILVVAPWLSEQTRQRLRDQRINYLDLTGNASIRLDNPALFLETEGARRDPAPLARGKARLQGPKAGRLLRRLIDIAPPYGVRELAASTGLAAGYVSRLLDTLDDEALIKRSPRGGVETVDVPGLLRRWAGTYDVFRSNQARTYLFPAGPAEALRRLTPVTARTAVTGSFAAVRLAAVAGPALLALYCDDPDALAEELELIPTDSGANVVVLTPFDPIVWEQTSMEDGLTMVSASQVAVDCLTGNGRMPAEGDAVLAWMTDNEDAWRLRSLPVRAEGGS
jgi:hypothetical protein